MPTSRCAAPEASAASPIGLSEADPKKSLVITKLFLVPLGKSSAMGVKINQVDIGKLGSIAKESGLSRRNGI